MSRGRGGRGGGRGGAAKSFNREQLSALGITGNEMLPGIVTQPPSLYPLLDRRPVPLNAVSDIDYLLILRQDYIDHMQLSGSFIKMPEDQKGQPVQEIDKLVAQLPAAKEKYDWSVYPSELRPKLLAKRPQKKATDKEVNVDEKLQALEKLEETASAKVKVEEEEEKEDADVAEELEEVEELDEEMDDGTDYANNYFDNGEAYEEEDDNLDDGPIY